MHGFAQLGSYSDPHQSTSSTPPLYPAILSTAQYFGLNGIVANCCPALPSMPKSLYIQFMMMKNDSGSPMCLMPGTNLGKKNQHLALLATSNQLTEPPWEHRAEELGNNRRWGRFRLRYPGQKHQSTRIIKEWGAILRLPAKVARTLACPACRP